MEEQTITAKGKPTVKNALQFLVYTRGLAMLMMIVSIYTLFTLYYTTTMYGDQQAILMVSLQKAILPTILSMLLYLLVLFALEYRGLKKSGIENEDTIFFINREGITQQKGHIQEKTGWSNILKIKEYKSLFLFRHSFQKWTFLPKHYFQTDEDLARFKMLIQECHQNSPIMSNEQTLLNAEDKEVLSIDNHEAKIVAKGNYTFKEYNHYVFLFQRKLILVYIILCISWCSLMLSDLLKPGIIWDFASSMLLLFSFFLIIGGAFLLYFILQRQSRKEYHSDPLSRKEKIYIFDEEGLSYAPGRSFAQLKWKDFRKVREYKKLFLFYTHPQRAILIPFRLFESQEDVEKVKQLIKEQMNSKQVKFRD